jgi:hypothetical protein
VSVATIAAAGTSATISAASAGRGWTSAAKNGPAPATETCSTSGRAATKIAPPATRPASAPNGGGHEHPNGQEQRADHRHDEQREQRTERWPLRAHAEAGNGLGDRAQPGPAAHVGEIGGADQPGVGDRAYHSGAEPAPQQPGVGPCEQPRRLDGDPADGLAQEVGVRVGQEQPRALSGERRSRLDRRLARVVRGDQVRHGRGQQQERDAEPDAEAGQRGAQPWAAAAGQRQMQPEPEFAAPAPHGVRPSRTITSRSA